MRKISFTGSTATGTGIMKAAAGGIKRVSLELGGKSPNIVFEDADLDAAVNGAISGIFAATGQTCIAGSRLLVQRSVNASGHCGFTPQQIGQAFGDLVLWTQYGVKPAP